MSYCDPFVYPRKKINELTGKRVLIGWHDLTQDQNEAACKLLETNLWNALVEMRNNGTLSDIVDFLDENIRIGPDGLYRKHWDDTSDDEEDDEINQIRGGVIIHKPMK